MTSVNSSCGPPVSFPFFPPQPLLVASPGPQVLTQNHLGRVAGAGGSAGEWSRRERLRATVHSSQWQRVWPRNSEWVWTPGLPALLPAYCVVLGNSPSPLLGHWRASEEMWMRKSKATCRQAQRVCTLCVCGSQPSPGCVVGGCTLKSCL